MDVEWIRDSLIEIVGQRTVVAKPAAGNLAGGKLDVPRGSLSRMYAEIEGDFVVLVIGHADQQALEITHKWMPVFSAMPRCSKKLEKQPERGSRSLCLRCLLIVQ